MAADAMVQHVEAGTKHIFLISRARNSAGTVTTYECRSCDFGCMTHLRPVADDSGWHAIRRVTW
jgi:hypothetical protein